MSKPLSSPAKSKSPVKTGAGGSGSTAAAAKSPVKTGGDHKGGGGGGSGATPAKSGGVDRVEGQISQYISSSDGLGVGDDYTVVQQQRDGPSRYPETPLSDWRQLVGYNSTWRKLHQMNPKLGLDRAWDLECGAGGDCLFHSVSSGYNALHRRGDLMPADVRAFAAQMLTVHNVEVFLATAFETAAFPASMYNMILPMETRVATVRAQIAMLGDTYWGDTLTLAQLLVNHPQFVNEGIGFAVVKAGVKQFRVPVDVKADTTKSDSKAVQKTAASASGTATAAATAAPTTTTTTTTVATSGAAAAVVTHNPASLKAVSATTASSAPTSAPAVVPASAPLMKKVTMPTLHVEIIRREDTKHLMYLYNLGNNHWRLLGLVGPGETSGQIRCVFPVTDIPTPLAPYKV